MPLNLVWRFYLLLQEAQPGCSWIILTVRTLIISIPSFMFCPVGGYSSVSKFVPPRAFLYSRVSSSAGYYNEARILDPKTLQTVRVLPNIPGSVTSFLAGRTYPNEGTAVMLPQYPPYTQPVTIMVCGGSNFGVALDNCVSIQPEAANPAWTIERMVRSHPDCRPLYLD